MALDTAIAGTNKSPCYTTQIYCVISSGCHQPAGQAAHIKDAWSSLPHLSMLGFSQYWKGRGCGGSEWRMVEDE